MDKLKDYIQNLFASRFIDEDDELMGAVDLSDPYCASLFHQEETQ